LTKPISITEKNLYKILAVFRKPFADIRKSYNINNLKHFLLLSY